MDKMEKKPYTPPTITKFGKIVEETKGYGGVMWELQGLASYRPGTGDVKRPS
jgi:hypothetical protein